MELLRTKKPQRKKSIYSSQRQLVNNETSTDDENITVSQSSISKLSDIAQYSPEKVKSETIEMITYLQPSDTEKIKSISSIESLKPTTSSDDVVTTKKKRKSKHLDKPDSVKSRKNSSNHSDAEKVKDEGSLVTSKNVEKKRVRNKKSSSAHSVVEPDIRSKFQIVGVHLLKSGFFINHPFLLSPFVRVSIVDFAEGKPDSEERTKMTKSSKTFSFPENKSIIPHWNEFILFDDDFLKMGKQLDKVLIFFEAIDQLNGDKSENIAWAFLKTNLSNPIDLNKKISLQFYEQLKNSTVFECWKTKPWKAYPNNLNIILKGVNADQNEDIINSIKLRIIAKQRPKFKEEKQKVPNYQENVLGQPCKIPNAVSKAIYSIEKGSIVMKFSNCGQFLACATSRNNKNVIVVYKIPDYTEVVKLYEHTNLVYDICWSNSSKIVTASSDCTACVWDISLKTKNMVHVLKHPAFVYTSKFCPTNESIIATGSFDCIVRLWTVGETNFKCQQELEGHEGFVNAICFLKNHKIFFSGDSTGVIMKWGCERNVWFKITTINLLELKGKIINDLILFPDNQRILIVLRNSPSLSLDIATSTVFSHFKNGPPHRYQIRGCISPCGTLVFIGNCIWEVLTGQLLSIYNPDHFHNNNIMAVDYHPKYSLLAIACALRNTPLLFCHYQNQENDVSLGIEILAAASYVPSVEDNDKSKPETSAIKSKKYFSMKELSSVTIVDETTHPHKRKGLKLWSLLDKMDNILFPAKDVHDYLSQHSNEDKEKKQENSVKVLQSQTDSESNAIISVNLTNFHYVMERNKKSLNLQNTDKIRELNYDDTYTVNNKIVESSIESPSLKSEDLINDRSSTLSHAESLEDDVIVI